jgi:hypothetical protein
MSDTEINPDLEIIDSFLSAALLSDLGDDNTRYAHVRSTVANLKSELEEDKSALLAFSLVAFKPDPSSDDPQIVRTYEAFKRHWKTIDNSYKQERPVTFLRALMLETIHQLNTSPEFAAIVYHANASAFPHQRFHQAEGKIIKRILTDAAEAAESFAMKLWEQGGQKERPHAIELEIDLPAVTVETAKLQDGFLAASGPHDAASQPPNHPAKNQYFPNSGQNWTWEFAPIAAVVVSDAIKASTKGAMAKFAQSASTALNEGINNIQNSVFSQTDGKSKQLELLWWSQSLYSSTLRQSYRDLSPIATTVVAPHELIDQIGAPVPESVVHFLGETVLSASGEAIAKLREPTSLSKWLKELTTAETQGVLKELNLTRAKSLDGTPSLLELVRATVHKQQIPKNALGKLGDAVVSPRQLAMWLYRDLLAERLAGES